MSGVCVDELNITSVEVLQGGSDVERPSPSERAPAVGSYDGGLPVRDGLRVENGNINRFVKKHKDTNRFDLVGICFHRSRV